MSENTKQQGSSTSQNSTETTSNYSLPSQGTEKFDRGNIEKIEDTVFGIANNEKGWFLVMGNNIITTPKDTRKECLQQLEDDKWNIIMKMIILVVDKTIEVAMEERDAIEAQSREAKAPEIGTIEKTAIGEYNLQFPKS